MRGPWYPFHDLRECFILEWRVPGNTGVWWYADEVMALRSLVKLRNRYTKVDAKIVRFVPAKRIAKRRAPKKLKPGTAKAITARYA
jgi:hypothetical protein